MAKTLKWPSSLAVKAGGLANQRANNAGLTIAGGVGGLLLAYILVERGADWASWIGVMSLIIAGAGLISLISPSDKEKFLESGIQGEMAVARLLDALPDGWFIVNDVTIQGTQIDHIAAGPNGLFCIETKNWNTAGTDQQGNWYKYKYGQWQPIEENPARQNLGHIRALKSVLGKRCPRCNSIIVLSAYPNGVFSIASRVVPPGDAVICSPAELHQFLLTWQGINWVPEEAERIAHDILENNNPALKD